MTTTLTPIEQKTLVLNAVDEFLDFMNSRPNTFLGEKYELTGGRKYLRISTPASVHCFVEALTGDVYMAASVAKPMLNGARYNLLDADSFEKLKSEWDPFGSYLYKRR